MPRWRPEAIWMDQPAYIIGGGPSLHAFDFSLLEGRHTIGCNQAYRLGASRCELCFVGDTQFFYEHLLALNLYDGTVVTNNETLARSEHPPWLLCIPRKARGLSPDGSALGWNQNSGAAAINLALILGASPVYLLGFDMAVDEGGKMHWHDGPGPRNEKEVFRKHQEGMGRVHHDMLRVFPDREVINLTDGTSRLDWFLKEGVVGHFQSAPTA